MPTSYYSKYVKCPFYHYDGKREIFCEGVLPKTIVRQSFDKRSEKIKWQEKYCNQIKGYEKCPFYCAANKKYEVNK